MQKEQEKALRIVNNKLMNYESINRKYNDNNMLCDSNNYYI